MGYILGHESMKGVRFGVYIPPDLAKELNECMGKLEIRSKSQLVQEALRLFIAEHRWKLSGQVVGAIGVIYNHDVGEVDEELTDIQHKYLDIVVGAFHLHLDRENCLLMIVVRGESSKIKGLLNELIKVKGVKIARPLLLAY